ncbi:MAG TPA: carboxypeptidase regulatory-like domain-containing protein [Thermoanaerobaculia bacterium]|jgi:ELWxxDGT repeat protein|nr:carboxypeptidase regulatory-like domain-containing protein [Thermoanaerobaculia bacterium]
MLFCHKRYFGIHWMLAALFILTSLSSTAAIPLGNSSMPDGSGVGTTVALGDSWFFAATNADGDRLIWRTDGTEAGTWPLTDSLGGTASEPTVANGKLFFRQISTTGQTLYVSDGTVTGTQALGAIPGHFIGWIGTDSLLYLITRDAARQVTILTRSDGTVEGTSVLREFGRDSSVYDGNRQGHFFYFQVGNEVDDTIRGVWRSDGTAAGTFRLLEPGSGRTELHRAQPVGDADVFDRNNQVWTTDGTIAGTRPLFPPGSSVVGSVGGFVYVWIQGELRTITGVGGQATFVATMADRPTVSASDGNRLFLTRHEAPHFVGVTDGTTLGTRVHPLPFNNLLYYLQAAGGFAYFPMYTAALGQELWRSDGTSAGTTIVRDIFPGVNGAEVGSLVAVGDRVLFNANDGVHGIEPWITDGTAEGTKLMANIYPELTVRGTVTAAETGAPISDAVIQVSICEAEFGACQNQSFPVDANGAYTIEGLTPATHWFTARHTGGDFISQNWDSQDCEPCDPRTGTSIEGTPGATRDGIDFVLQRSGTITGKITDANGAPVAGVEIVVAKTFGGPTVARAISGSDGTYEINTPIPSNDSFLVYTTDRAGYSGVIYPSTSCAAGCDSASTGTPVQVAAGSTREGINFTVKPWGRVQGRVLDKVSGKAVTLTNSPLRIKAFGTGNEIYHFFASALVTGATYTLALPDGRYRLLLEPLTPETSAYRTTCYPDIACTPTDFPAKGVAVSATPGTTTPGFDVTLDPIGGSMEGRVTDRRNGSPLAGIVVRIVNQSGLGVAALVTDSNGFYTTPPLLLAETYSVEATGRAPWFASKLEGIVIVGKEVKSGVDLQLDRHALVIGLVRDATTLKALQGVQLELENVNPLGTGAGADTNERGRFTTPGVRAGTYLVTARKSGWKTTTTTATVTTGSTAELVIAMPAECGPSSAPAVIDVPSTGGDATIPIADNCTRCAFSTSPFVHVKQSCSTGPIELTVDPNRSNQRREGIIVLPGRTITIRQRGN